MLQEVDDGISGRGRQGKRLEQDYSEDDEDDDEDDMEDDNGSDDEKENENKSGEKNTKNNATVKQEPVSEDEELPEVDIELGTMEEINSVSFVIDHLLSIIIFM